jgi:polyisoprenyl-teichoic acid--peptidoglycan teichoic acid transferase
MKWKHAFDNVEAMRVAPVVLPTMAPEAPVVSANVAKPTPEISSAPAEAQPPPEPTPIPKLDHSMNILLLGTDARIGEDISRTDALILVNLDGQTERVSMLSFPRDLWGA